MRTLSHAVAVQLLLLLRFNRAVLCCAVLCCAVLCGLRCCGALCCAVLCCAAHLCDAVANVVQHIPHQVMGQGTHLRVGG